MAFWVCVCQDRNSDMEPGGEISAGSGEQLWGKTQTEHGEVGGWGWESKKGNGIDLQLV